MTNHMRHIGIFAPLEFPVRLIGAGGIGAMTAVMLAKMSDGDVRVYDDDTVDDVNIANEILAGPIKRERPWHGGPLADAPVVV